MMAEIIPNERLAVARNLKIMDELSAAWIEEDGIKEMLFALTQMNQSALPKHLRDDCEAKMLAAFMLCFGEGAYRGYCAGVERAALKEQG